MKKLHELKISSIFPKHCAYCDSFIFGDELLCSNCKKSLPRIEGNICKSCGLPKGICQCKNRDNYYEAVIAPFFYEGNVRKGLHIYKFRNSMSNSEAFSLEMAKTIEERYNDISFDFIINVPMTKKRYKERGYDQTALLAEKISSILGIEFKPDILEKIYETEKQHGLHALYRRGNLTGAFEVTNPELVKDKTIILCDDISTSGETLNECSKMLWLNDAKAVYCVALALTKPKKKVKR